MQTKIPIWQCPSGRTKHRKEIMKDLTRTLLAIAGVSTFVVTSALAQPYTNETWFIDENGPALLQGGPLAGYAQGTNKLDPLSGLVAWYYPLAGPNAASIAGDVLLREPPIGTNSTISDLLRFDGIGGVYFFSDLEPNDPNPDHADVPVMPSINTSNFVFLNEVGPEGNNGALYIPNPGQPGYDLSGLFPGIKYNIISDVPEPNAFALAVTGGLLFLNRVRRFSKRSRSRISEWL